MMPIDSCASSQYVALVTGASRGIGREIARYFARQGFKLILVARDEARLAKVSRDLHVEFGIETEIVQTDISDFQSTKFKIEDVLQRFDRLDVLVNSAGIFRFGTSTAPLDDVEAMLRVNMLGTHNLCQICINYLQRSRHGRIFNIASIAGTEAFAPIGGYVASKHALVGYGLSLARELLAKGIKVTTLCPDVVNTDMAATSGMAPDEMISTQDISRAIDFILSLSPAAIVEQLTISCKPPATGVRAES